MLHTPLMHARKPPRWETTNYQHFPGQQEMNRVLIHGLAHFSRQFPRFLASEGWEIRHYENNGLTRLMELGRYLHGCDLAYTWGGRITMGKFLSVARLLRKKKVVMFWCGSDTLEARAEHEAGRTDSWIADRIHWAGAPWLAEEVRAMGLRCEYVPSTWVTVPVEVPGLPKKFSVLAYLPDAERVQLYGIDHVLEVARRLPSVEFNIVGLRPSQTLNVPANVNLHGWSPDLASFYRNTTVVWRPARHDGLSFIALEALGHARHVLWSYPFPGATLARDSVAGYEEIQRLLDLHHRGSLAPNHAGARYIAEKFSPQSIRYGILSRWKRIIEQPEASSYPLAPLEEERSH